jgi:PII-like signaling protein
VGAVPKRDGASTIEQIAALAGVSRSTVSRVLNNHPSVRADVRARVQRVIDEHRYTPSSAARSLASRRTNAVGLLIPRSAAVVFSDPFFPNVIQGIPETCTNRGYLLMLSMVTAEREPDFFQLQRLLRGHGVDGATVLLGVDGTVRGDRTRARFFGRNAEVPLMITSVGEGEAIARALPRLEALLARPLATLAATRGQGFTLPERVVLAWAGLRGAVPIVFATIPVAAGVPGSRAFFDVVFFSVVVSTLLQGLTFERLSRVLGLTSVAAPLPRPLVEFGGVRRLDHGPGVHRRAVLHHRRRLFHGSTPVETLSPQVGSPAAA